jgi:hypothetical protein
VLDELELRQEEAEPRDNKTKSHQGKTSTNPCKKSSLGSQIIAECGLLSDFRLPIHFAASCQGRSSAHLI